jgi:hypothetical protein
VTETPIERAMRSNVDLSRRAAGAVEKHKSKVKRVFFIVFSRDIWYNKKKISIDYEGLYG